MKVFKKITTLGSILLCFGLLSLSSIGALLGPTKISSEISSSPQVKTDPDGNAIVTWMECDGINSSIQAKTFSGSENWSKPMTISRFIVNFNENGHKLAIDPAGNAIAIWPEQIDDLHSAIKSSILPFKASKWMPSVALSDLNKLNKIPELSLGFSGSGMATWVDDLGLIQFVPFTNGRWLLPAMDFLPSTNGSNPKIVVDSSGNTVIVWEEIIDGEISIMGARLPFGKTEWISSNAPLSRPNAHSPQVAVNTDGEASAVWVNESNIIQYSNLKSGTDDWSSPPHNLSDGNFASSQPQIIIDLDGNITTVWKADNFAGSIIQSATRSFDGEWQPPINVSDSHGNASDPQLAVDQVGNVAAVWRNIISHNNIVIQSSRLSEKGVWSEPINLSNEGEKAGLPRISSLNNGNIIVIWPNETLGVVEAVLAPQIDTHETEKPNVLNNAAPAPLVLPVVTGISPTCGPVGTSVTITGTGFTGVTAVAFGGVPATSFTVNNDTSITAVVPGGSLGSVVHTTVTNPSGTSATSSSDQFTYVAGIPSLTAPLSPISGLPAGGNSVVITGTDFYGITGPSAVKFGATNATSYTVNSPTQITAVAPAGTVCTSVNVTVSNCMGTSNPEPYTYLPPAPTVTSLSPSSGSPLGGNSVIITGTNFFGVTGANAVQFGTNNATSYIVNSPTQITAVSPVASACQVNVTVTNCTSTSAASPANLYTYTLGIPTVTALSVASGSPAGGTSVNITGTNFYNVPGVTAIMFGGVPATSFTVNSTTSITAVSPPATVCGTVDVRVTTCDGTSAISNADKFTYSAPLPKVTGVNPSSGPITGGTSVVITGSNFYNVAGITAVSFGGIPAASFTVDSPTQITAISPVGILSCDPVDITVTTCSGTSVETADDQFSFTAIPTITGLSQSSGTAAGGTTVVITGTNFFSLPGTSVLFGNNPAATITVDSSTQITVTSPPGTLTCAPIDITVTTCQGTSPITAADQFTYTAGTVPANPSITGISPSSGPQAGGTSVSISGTNLFTPTSVTFGGIPSTSFSSNSAGTVITALSPAGVPSCFPVDIVVTNCQGSSAIVPADQFTYMKPLPTVTNVAPVSGPPSGGTSVTITGTNFYSQSQVTAVTFGGVPASYTVDSPTQITAISPPGLLTCTTVDIQVTTCNGGTSISTGIQDNFVYQTPPPTVTAINPTSGTPAGNTLVTISGTNLYEVATVYFGNSPATIVGTDPNGAFIQALSPGGPISCVPVEITVVTCSGTSSPTTADFYTYAITPTVTSISPVNGPLAGGTSVTISGTDFYDITQVLFGGVPATSFTVNSLGQITAIAPSTNNCGPVHITVANCGATSPTSPNDIYTYGPTGVATVVSVNPSSGTAGGGTSVTIVGTHFIGTTAVEFGGIPAASYTVNSDIQITAISPPGVPCSAVDVTVTNCGISAISNADQFSYTVIPTITGLSVPAGPCSGGTTVVITGTEFYDVTSVTFDGIPATIVNYTPTQITVITPANIPCNCTPIDVRVTTCAGTSPITSAAKFIYTNFIGTVTGITPPSGPPEGGTPVTITGSNFSGTPTVYFGNNLATNVVVVNPTTITAVSPAGKACTTVPITVLQCDTNTVGSGSSASFTYVAGVPTVTGLSPSTGSLTGGTIVSITGTGFYAPATVNFGTNAATNVVINSPTQITATAPAGLACETVDVTVTTCGGTSPTSSADEFTYSTPSGVTVTGISPSTGTPYGGTSVVITGTNFYGLTGPDAVKFGTVNATSYVVNSPTQITAVSPAATNACSVHITVTACSTTSIPTPADLFTYAISGGAPIVQELTVASGLPTGGTSLIIIGKNFYNVAGTTSVMFGSVPASSFTVNSPTSISVISPPGPLCTQVDVTVTTCQGTSALSPDDVFLYTAPPPTVTTLNPMSGPLAGGNTVIITGMNFYDIPPTGAVLFGSIPATSYTVDSLTQITAIAPPGVLTCEPVYVTVTNCIGTSPNLNTDMYIYTVPAPTISGISPTTGTPAGGNPVVITGTNFYNVPGQTAVTFGGIPATNFTVDSLTQITATTPPGPLTCLPIDVEVTICNSVISPQQFEYTAPVPNIIGVSPISGPLSGGTEVTITGTNFFTITEVSFGGIPASSFSVISPTQIKAIAPAGVPSCSPIDITVTNCEGTSSISSADQFIYNLNPPTITKISPTNGSLAGGTTVTITGTNFYNVPGVMVSFGGLPATSVTVNSLNQITAISPPGSLTCNAVDVTVTICGVTSPITNADHFIYTAPAPTITSISSSTGSPLGGTTVVITGSNFFNVQSVHFGNNLATIVPPLDPTGNTITVTSPSGLLTCSPVHISVTTCEGTSAPTSADLFTYTAPPPSITPPLNPTSGSPSGGTAVVITGNNFFNITSVKFGSVNATSFNVNSPTQITAFSPAGTACSTVQITVTNCLGTSNSSPFLYLPLSPVVTGISPNSGPVTTSVTISGLNFLGVSQVFFGATPATSFNVVNNSTITAVAPTGTNCSTVDITVVSCSGTSPTSSADQYTYKTAPTITSISPNTGPSGTTVTINGTNFTGTTAVTFGSTPATSFSFVTDTQLTAVVPVIGLTNCQQVDIRVTTCAGTSAIVAADKFSYQTMPVTAPSITSISPAFGPPTTSVTINGAGFTGTTGPSGVKFGATNAASYTVVNDSQIIAVAPSGTNCSTVDIRVTTCVGTSPTSPADQFQYQTTPTVTSLSPSTGSAGNLITITGTNFLGATAVNFGSTPATPFTIVNNTTITTNVPTIAGATNCEVFDVRVTTCAGISPINIPNDQFSYQTLGLPIVSSLSVNVGPPSGGTAVTINGNNFTGISSVKFGTASATIINSTNTSIDVIAPAGTSCSTVDVTVTTCVGTSATSAADKFTYSVSVPSPIVTSLSVTAGPPSGGTIVTINGSNFTGVTAVHFGASSVPFTFLSDNSVRVTSPAGPACSTVDVTVTTCAGTSATSPADQFTYNVSVPLPVVSGVTPAAGSPSGGTFVTINGSGFTGATAVNFGGVMLSQCPTGAPQCFTINSDTSITVDSSPSGTPCSTVDVTVTTCGGVSLISPADHFTYNVGVPQPIVSGLNPSVGPAAGGTVVTINGSDFTGVTAVHFGATSVPFTFNSDTSITVTSPSGLSCSVADITVTTCAGTSALTPEDQFTYNVGVPTPVVTSLTPAVGPPAGGTPITINGTAFTGVTAVHFGATSVPFTFNNDSSISITSLPGAACSTTHITVTTCGGTSITSPLNLFTFSGLVPAPTVDTISPSSGPIGTSVTISGSGFIGASSVKFGSTSVAFSIVNDTTITATAPDPTDCIVDVTVTNCVGTSPIVPSDKFTYTGLFAPHIISLNPNFGPSAGLNVVQIVGTGFIGSGATTPLSVNFGSTPAAILSSSPSLITVIAPPAPFTVCNLTVTVTGCTGTSNPVPYFYVYPPSPSPRLVAPIITSITPNNGPVAGTNSVVISGTNLNDISAVMFGSIDAAFTPIDSNTINAVVPPSDGSSCTVDVVVVTCTEGDSNALPYTYDYPLPVIQNVNPNNGSPAGGNIVTLTGTNFIGVTSVHFGTQNAPIVSSSSTSLEVQVPPGQDCEVHITITGCAGTSLPIPADRYTYNFPIPTITSVVPDIGPTAGGNSVVIRGTNFVGVTLVNFGANPASFTVDSQTQITAIAPSGNLGTVDIQVMGCSGTSIITPLDHYTYQDAPFPPSNFIGCIKKNKFLNKTTCVLEATWSPSTSANVVSYRIYKGTQVVAEIPATSPRFFQQPLPDCTANGYSIVAVNNMGLESSHVPLQITN